MKSNLQKWLSEGSIVPHKSNEFEIADLFRIVSRDIKDSKIKELSTDRRFATAYNGALQLCTIVLVLSGYRPKAKNGHHFITISAIPELLGNSQKARSIYFNACRTKRNITDYDREGEISDAELNELLDEVSAFESEIKKWALKKMPGLKLQ